jgi:hypothetical protein
MYYLKSPQVYLLNIAVEFLDCIYLNLAYYKPVIYNRPIISGYSALNYSC